jgi:hypothetical protein
VIIPFVRDRILPLLTKTVALPVVGRDGVAVEKNLFGWILRIGREPVPCASEEEARYLKVFAEMGFTSIPIPENPRDLADVVPGLERAYEQAVTTIEEEASWIIDPKQRRQLVELVWNEVRECLAVEEAPLAKTRA